MSPLLLSLLAVTFSIVLFVALAGLMIKRGWVHVPPGSVLLLTNQTELRVSRTSAYVIPVLQHGTLLRVEATPLRVEHVGDRALHFGDGARANATATLTIDVPMDLDAIRRVATEVGAARANDPGELHALFAPRLSDALQTVAGAMTSDAFLADRDAYRRRVRERLGDLGGFRLVDLALDASIAV